MASDAHVVSARLRAPTNLSSSTSAYIHQRRMLHLSAVASTSLATTGGGAAPSSIGHLPRLLMANPSIGPSGPYDGETYDQQLQHQRMQNGQSLYPHPLAANAAGGSSLADDPIAWLDLDRFEDWEKPTLDVLRPDVRIEAEDVLFPIAVAEDGETLPSDLHPSYPYGDIHLPNPTPYVSRQQTRSAFDGLARVSGHGDPHSVMAAGPLDGPLDDEDTQSRFEGDAPDGDPTSQNSKSDHELDKGEGERLFANAMGRLVERSRQSVRPNIPHWPFKRFGPGPGGPNSLFRAELRRPWRPYRAVWAELDLTSNVPRPAHRRRANGARH